MALFRTLDLQGWLFFLQGCVDLFTGRADRKFFGVTIGDPLLAT